ncbi:MAG: hypothetical protein M1833_000782 [Piccolia ochrophora]|nr:MAG: hypothetical protein M1833_000782 [Piccolia ochrophora]
MLDENLPTFFIKSASNDVPHQSTLYLTHHGDEPQPAYTLRRPDPSLSTSKNCYAIGLFDAYNPEVLFSEVLVRLQWTQPSLSAAEVRRNGGVAIPPEPIIPPDFTIQLYAPDQQVHVRQRQSTWSGSTHWVFDMPQRTFREPSTSSLDQSQSDPAAADTTSRLRFKWKREGSLSKDLVCTLSGRSTNPDGTKRKGSREPDITLALYKHFKAITIYESNLSRVEMEDLKGLEVVLLLSAVTIRDMFFSNAREAFNISVKEHLQRDVGNEEKGSTHASGATPTIPPRHNLASAHAKPNLAINTSPPKASRPYDTHCPYGAPPQAPSSHNDTSKPPDQQSIDAETARLKAQVEAEEKARKKAEREDAKRARRLVESEEKEARRKQAEIDKETERLKRLYLAEKREAGRQTQRPNGPARPAQPANLAVPFVQDPYQRPQSAPLQAGFFPRIFNPQVSPRPPGPYLQPQQQRIHGPSSSGFFPSHHSQTPYDRRYHGHPGQGPSSQGHSGHGHSGPGHSGHGHSGHGFFGLRSHSDGSRQNLAKKRSSIF